MCEWLVEWLVEVQSDMRTTLILLLIVEVIGCQGVQPSEVSLTDAAADSSTLVQMIADREQAMIGRDIETAMAQFADDATWINSQGYFFEGKTSILQFHEMLASRDSVDYYYEAGQPRIRMVDRDNALAYYSWKMFWYDRENPADTTFREIGLMTLTAKRIDDAWKWVAVTNQHTPWFYDTIDVVSID